jgi:hypothetical protein
MKGFLDIENFQKELKNFRQLEPFHSMDKLALLATTNCIVIISIYAKY